MIRRLLFIVQLLSCVCLFVWPEQAPMFVLALAVGAIASRFVSEPVAKSTEVERSGDELAKVRRLSRK
jgi:hypothetical protein